MLLGNYTMTVTPPECLPSEIFVTATVEFGDDLSELMPYLNAELGPCVYERNIPFLRFRRDGKLIAVYPKKVAIAGLRDEEEAREVLEWFRETVNSVESRKDLIEPSFWSLSNLKPLDVFKLLPRTNCGQCVQRTCMAFAAAVVTGEATIDECPPLRENPSNHAELLAMFHVNAYDDEPRK